MHVYSASPKSVSENTLTPQLPKVATLLALLLFSIGCEDAGPALSGSVTYNGAPVADGYITFTPVESGTSFAAKITNGQYEPEKVYAGQYRVLVSATTAELTKPKTR